MKLEHTRMHSAAHTCSLVAAAVVGVLPLAVAPSVASAETHGNEPDFAVSCPRPDAARKDPNIETVVGKYAYGFDLGVNPANKFLDPETHEKVDNQLWRAVGCATQYQARPPAMRNHQEGGWIDLVDSAPGRAIRFTGADLSKDGPGTVTLDRTREHLSTGRHTYTHEEPIDPKLGYQLKCSWFQQFYFPGLCQHAIMLDRLKAGSGSLLDHVVLLAFTEHSAPVSSSVLA